MIDDCSERFRHEGGS